MRGIAGLVGGDIIIAIDDVPIRDFDQLSSYLIAKTEVGQGVKITFLRGTRRSKPI